MPSSIWTGAVSFGLVQVPVRMVTATRSKDVSFNQLEDSTGARIRYRKVSEVTGEEVPTDQIVRGYEVSKGKYVRIEDEEIQSLRPKGSRAIEIEEFVDLDEIDPVFFEQPYYLVPDQRGVKPYKLLVEAMTDLNKVAIGRIVMRSKERLVAIRPLDGMLCVETMRYSDEVVARDGLVPEEEDEAELTERERTMAQQLVESLASDHFDAGKYHDQFREQVLDLIERKASGEEIIAEPEIEAPAKVLDLVAALEASLAKAETAKARHPSTAGRKAGADDAATDEDEDDEDEVDEDQADGETTAARSKKAATKATKATKTAKKTPAKKATRSKRSA
jgi:DNA end-binding protein Ku